MEVSNNANHVKDLDNMKRRNKFCKFKVIYQVRSLGLQGEFVFQTDERTDITDIVINVRSGRMDEYHVCKQ